MLSDTSLLLLAGALGGLVSATYRGFTRAFLIVQAVLLGALSSYYLAPVALPLILNLSVVAEITQVGFVVGLIHDQIIHFLIETKLTKLLRKK